MDRRLILSLRWLVGLGALTIFAGTAATAAGPHAGGSPGQKINRLDFDGHGTMDFVIHRHGEIALAFGLAAVAVWWMARRRHARPVVQRSLTVLCVLLALQGVVGLDQYETHLPTRARVGARRARLRRLAGDPVGGLRGRFAGSEARQDGPGAARERLESGRRRAASGRSRGAVPRKLGLSLGASPAFACFLVLTSG